MEAKKHSDLETTINLMHNINTPMICVRGLEEREAHSGKPMMLHHLVVFHKENGECIEYVFVVRNGNDYLYGVEAVSGLTFDEILCAMAKDVLKDGYAQLQVFAQ